jgi:putative component of membrane protein insertase Oxa1/YidC/SpoIIIJ protein YidD
LQVIARLTLWVIRNVYQRWWTRFTPACWQSPSCSQYGYAAIRDHGFRAGIIMAAERIESCTTANRELAEEVTRHEVPQGPRRDRDRAHA